MVFQIVCYEMADEKKFKGYLRFDYSDFFVIITTLQAAYFAGLIGINVTMKYR